jgi:hypothetical protein
MSKLYDVIARNRAKLGGLFLAMWGVAQTDQALIAKHPRLNAYVAAAVTYVFASGRHKSDQYQRDQQERERLLKLVPPQG